MLATVLPFAAAASAQITPPLATYFPPPRPHGSWRSAVTPNVEATSDEQLQVRDRCGIDWQSLKQVWDYSQTFGGGNRALVIRHGWIAGEWFTHSEQRSIASCTKPYRECSM